MELVVQALLKCKMNWKWMEPLPWEGEPALEVPSRYSAGKASVTCRGVSGVDTLAHPYPKATHSTLPECLLISAGASLGDNV